MKKIIVLTGLLLSFLSTNVQALDLEAKSYYIAEVETGTPVLAKNENEQLPPASLTKLMTTYLIFEALKNGEITLDTEMPISEKAWRKGGSKMFLEVGKRVRTEDLIKGITIVSGNDACIVAAEFLAGTEDGFADMMNKKAAALGMENTHFTNASGWPDPAQYTSAKDMVTLASALIRNFPEYYPYFSMLSFEYSNIKQTNRNRLLTRGQGVDGLKTGHTEEAGYHLVSSAENNGTRLVSTVMGTDSFSQRENQTMTGLSYGFRSYQKENLVTKGSVIEERAPVWLGEKEYIPLLAAGEITLFSAKKDSKNIDFEIIYENPLPAPITAGQKVGTLKLTNPTTGAVLETDLLAGESVAELGFFASLWAQAKHSIGW